ncbi:MAG: hypothetical protein ACRD1S_06810 [Vicinamibacterales bacterium]
MPALRSGDRSGPPDPFKSVKVSDVVLRRLISEGHARSDISRRLVQDLDASGWLVFVQPGPCPEKAAVACLLHVVGTFEGSRYVRVLVDYRHRHPDNVIATLAHELQHALEVAQAPEVKDTATMRALFERIGTVRVRSATAIAYATEAARRVGEQVLRDLEAPEPDVRGAGGARRGPRSSRMSVRNETAPSERSAAVCRKRGPDVAISEMPPVQKWGCRKHPDRRGAAGYRAEVPFPGCGGSFGPAERRSLRA